MLKRILLFAAWLLGLPYAAGAARQGLNQLKAGAVDTSPHYKELHLAPSTCAAPCVDYALSAELENDWVFAASPASLKSNDLYPTLESAVILAPLNHVRLIGDFIFEPVNDPQPGQSTAFKDLGAYVDQLFMELEYEAFNLQVESLVFKLHEQLIDIGAEVLEGSALTGLRIVDRLEDEIADQPYMVQRRENDCGLQGRVEIVGF